MLVATIHIKLWFYYAEVKKKNKFVINTQINCFCDQVK